MADVATDVTSALADVDILDAQLAALLPGEHDVSPSKPGDFSISRQVARNGHWNVYRTCQENAISEYIFMMYFKVINRIFCISGSEK